MSVSWRWGVVGAGLAVLMSLPALVAARPVPDPRPDGQQLLAAVRASSGVAWSGYGESRGTLALPDSDRLDALPALLGGTTRVRAWWRGSRDFRVDALTLVGETDTAQDAEGTWTWSSADRTAVRVVGDLPVRLPSPGDLLAPVLGRRLARDPGLRAESWGAGRVAGRTTAGLRLRPLHPRATSIGTVDLWVEPATGLALRVEVTAAGADQPAVSTLLLDLELSSPSPDRTAFRPPADAVVSLDSAPDVAALVNRLARYDLPEVLAGVSRARQEQALQGDGVALYGTGLEAFVLLPLPRDTRVTDSPDGRIDAGLLHGQVVPIGRRTFLLAGTVPVSLLDRAAAELRARPPQRRPDP